MYWKFEIRHIELPCCVFYVNLIHLKNFTVVLTVLLQQILAKSTKCLKYLNTYSKSIFSLS